jgi:hypothetical protein
MGSRYALALVTQKAQEAMSPHQYGAGQADGCTQIVQSIQHLLTAQPHTLSPPLHSRREDIPLPVSTIPPTASPSHLQHASRTDRRLDAPEDNGEGPLHCPSDLPPSPRPTRPMACLSVDIKNAFNSVDRAAILRAVYANPDLAQCWRTVAFAYGQPSLLLMQCDDCVSDSEAFLESQTGVRQGDPLAAMLFCLAMHKVYDTLAQLTSQGCYAFVDDGNLVGTIDECWRAWTTIYKLLAPLGLTVNATKCELTCFQLDQVQDVDDTSALNSFRAADVKINDRSLRLLGCVIGADDSCVADELKRNKLFRLDRLAAFRRVPLMSKHTGMLALQHLTGKVITNRLRAMPPATTLHHARTYDAGLLRVAHSIIGIAAADGDQYDEQLQSSLSMGGFGLTSAVNIAPAAYLAGAENTLRLAPAFSEVWNGKRPLLAASSMSSAINDSLHRINTAEAMLISRCESTAVSEISPSILPADAASFAAHFRTTPAYSIQSAITHRISALIHIAKVTAAGRAKPVRFEELARLSSLRVAGSSLWLTTAPTEASLTLTDLKWQWAARLRLGMPVPSTDLDCGACGQRDAYTGNSWHSVSCTALSGSTMVQRHNNVVNIIDRFCRLMQVNARPEPAKLDHDSKKRPDLEIHLPGETLLCDVTISHPSSKSWRKLAAKRTVEAVGDRREIEKDNKYAEMAAVIDMKFHPIVLYTHGGFHKSALRFIHKLVGALDPATSLLSRAEFKEALMQHIAIAVQRGTADVMIRDSVRAREVMSGQLWHRHLARQGSGLQQQQQQRNEQKQQEQQQEQTLETAATSGGDVMDVVVGLVPLTAPLWLAAPQLGDDVAAANGHNYGQNDNVQNDSVSGYCSGRVPVVTTLIPAVCRGVMCDAEGVDMCGNTSTCAVVIASAESGLACADESPPVPGADGGVDDTESDSDKRVMMNCDRVNAVGAPNAVAADYADMSDSLEPLSVCVDLCVDAVDDVVCECDRPMAIMAAVLPVTGVSGHVSGDSVCVSVRCGLSGWMET